MARTQQPWRRSWAWMSLGYPTKWGTKGLKDGDIAGKTVRRRENGKWEKLGDIDGIWMGYNQLNNIYKMMKQVKIQYLKMTKFGC